MNSSNRIGMCYKCASAIKSKSKGVIEPQHITGCSELGYSKWVDGYYKDELWGMTIQHNCPLVK